MPIYETLFRDYCPTMVTQDCTTSQKLVYVIEACIPDWLMPYAETGTNIKVPEYLYTAPKPVIAAYLTGLFQADGWNSLSGDIGLTSVSETLIQGVSHLMTVLGIGGSVLYNKFYENHKKKHPSWMFCVGMHYNNVLQTLSQKSSSLRQCKNPNQPWAFNETTISPSGIQEGAEKESYKSPSYRLRRRAYFQTI